MNLIRASAKGDLGQVKKLVEEGADINATDSNGRTALLEAAWVGHTDIVKFLIERGASINAVDSRGFTPLMRAAEEGHTAVVNILLKKGADVNTRGNVRGSTPLMLAAERGELKIVELLLQYGAKINETDQFEETALARAYRADQLKTASFLESKGATRKPERSQFTYHDKELRPLTKINIPQWSAAAEDIAFEEEETEGDEPFEDE